MTELSPDPGRGVIDGSLPRSLLVGAAVTLAGALLGFTLRATDSPSWGSVAAMAAIVAGLIVTGIGVAAKPRSIPGLLIAAFVSAAARWGTHDQWDSFHLLANVLAAVAVVAAIVLLLPRPLRRFVACGLALFHFCGVLASITSPAPQSWLSLWAWTNVFRPHLVFCYTNNAYQFYSPEPGPASLLWFCIEGHDGQRVWFKMPRKPETRLDPLAVQFFRRLSITESANQNYSLASVPQQSLERRYQSVPQFPFHPEVPQQHQFRLPQDNVRRWISSFVRRVALMYGGPERVKSIRLYRVMHQSLDARQFRDGEDPFAKWTYLPYYLGEYDTTGTLLDPYDSTLFWLIPIVKSASGLSNITRPGSTPVQVENYLAKHAGSDPFEETDNAGNRR